MTDQKNRDEYVDGKQKKRSRKAKLQSAEETEESTATEHAIVGAIGPAWGDQSGNGPGEKPYKQKKLKAKNAMKPEMLEEEDVDEWVKIVKTMMQFL